MDRRNALVIATMGILAGNASALDLGGQLKSIGQATRALTLSEDEVRAYGRQMAERCDRTARIAADDHAYSRRIQRLTDGLRDDSGLSLNFKVYLHPEVNAFVTPDGSVRFYSGLLERFTDDELRFVVGHEIGHVVGGHTKKRMETALAASAVRSSIAASGRKAAVLADSQLGDLFEAVINAQHSQGNEREADDFALSFMTRRGYDAKACVNALEKLAALGGGGGGWLSTHPAPAERAERLRSSVR